jgi:hypothetical protein
MFYLTSGHPFFEHMLLNPTLLVFYDPVWFRAQWRRLAAALRPRTAVAPFGAG